MEVSYFRNRDTVYRDGSGDMGQDPPEADLSLLPMTIGEAIQIPEGIPQERHQAYIREHFEETIRYALKCGTRLSENLHSYYATSFKEGWFYLLFFNKVRAAGCSKHYVIQRVRVQDESYLENREEPCQTRHLYLVEAMKLNDHHITKRADQHLRVYSLGEASKRRIIVECEVGLGSILGEAEGEEWPYPESVLYRRIQDFSRETGLFDRVLFDASKVYKTMIEFDNRGTCRIRLPGFLRR